MGIDDAFEFDKLLLEGLKHIVLSDFQNLPDFKPVHNAQKIFEILGHCSKEADGRHVIDAADYGCSCSECREFKSAVFFV